MKNLVRRIKSNVFEKRQEIVFGDVFLWSAFLRAFPAFKNKNYQYYFFGQLVSLTGTWMHQVAEGWLVLQLTNSAFWVGVVAALNDLPILLFVLFGGVIVDRFPKKKILLTTTFLFLCLTLLLGILTITNNISVLLICIFAFVGGTISAIDMPARQAFIIEMVGKEKLASAIALNSATWNVARIIGPAIASLLIVIIGTGGAFLFDAVSFLAVIGALYAMTIKESSFITDSHPLLAMREGIKYSLENPTIKKLLIFTAISTIFGWSYVAMIPVIVKQVFHLGASGLGIFYTVSGMGAVLATIVISVFSKRATPFFFILLGNGIFSIFLILFSFSKTPAFALFFLFLVGFGIIMQFSTMNSAIQHIVKHTIRGRVMSIYTLMFLGMSPIGSFIIGFLSERMGPLVAIRIGASIVLVTAVFVYLTRKNITITS